MTSAAHESIYTAALSDDDVVRVLGPDGSLDARNDPPSRERK